jgi:hypothetical protein
MEKLSILAAVCLPVGLAAAAPVAAKPKDAASTEQTAERACAAERKADRSAFEEAYGPSAVRSCVESGRSAAKDTIRSATEQCREERGRGSRSRAAFRRAHGAKGTGRDALNRCISSEIRSDRRADRSEFMNAAQECRAERGDTEESRAAFEEKYGTKKGDMPMYRPQPRNAFGKCVSSKVSQSGKH